MHEEISTSHFFFFAFDRKSCMLYTRNKQIETIGGMHMAQVKQIVTGMVEENCYIIYEGDQALLVDPGDETSKIKDHLEELQVTPIAITLIISVL